MQFALASCDFFFMIWLFLVWFLFFLVKKVDFFIGFQLRCLGFELGAALARVTFLFGLFDMLRRYFSIIFSTGAVFCFYSCSCSFFL